MCVPLLKNPATTEISTWPNSKPGEQGREDLFHPYGKTYLQTLAEQD